MKFKRIIMMITKMMIMMMIKILAKARVNKKTVKVMGSGHSPSDIACTHGYMISLKNFNKILEVKIVHA